MPKPNKRKVHRQLAKLKKAINVILSDDLHKLCNETELNALGQSYLRLLRVFNSLHRHLV